MKITQERVDWCDGATIVILQTIVRAFQGARETHPGVPSVGFVSLRRRANAGAGIADPGGAPEPRGRWREIDRRSPVIARGKARTARG
ncbi:MAG: hypothetical protein EPO40_32585 [Myxococcaceae bacterium]|nr:MAG: hypothetical protein EPO40_32585 [Myxococcaceae bacterium]